MPHGSPEFEHPSSDDASCAAFDQRMHELLDDRLAPEDDSWMQTQSALSRENQQLLSGQQLMLDGLELSEIPELPDNFAERCVARATDNADPRPAPKKEVRSSSSKWRITAYAATMCVLLAVIAAEPLWTWLRSDASGESAVNSPAVPNAPEDTVPDAPDISPLPAIPEIADDGQPLIPDVDSPSGTESAIADDGPRYEDLYDMFRDLRERIPPIEGEENLLAVRPQWVDDMATGLRPMADSVGGALNVLRRNLPPTPKAEGGDKPQAWLNRDQTGTLG